MAARISEAESVSRYWAFLSYNSSDRRWAIWLQRALETYRIPKRLVGRSTPMGPVPARFRPVFRDGTELAANPDLVARISSALEQSAYLIVLCSPRAAKSHWVQEEIVRFRELHGSARILAVVLEGRPEAGEDSCFPPALRYWVGDPQAAGGLEPIAADLRPGADGRRRARLKLLAGMLGVGLDELVRRDAQRRMRWWIATASASLVALVVTGALATAALLARNEAQRQRNHAEGLIEFMLTDLRKQLEPSGRLDAMDGVGREALKYYEAQEPQRLDAQALSHRARALRLMGEIRLQRGDLGDALRGFEQASATTYELLSRAPGDGQRIFDHAQSVFWVGETARQRGDLVKAESSFQVYRSLAAELLAVDPKNDGWRAETAYAESALGVLLLGEGRTAEATGYFGRSLSVAADLAQRHSDDLSLQMELAQSHAWLADALSKGRRLGPARKHRETELEIYNAVLAKDANFRQAKYSTVVVLQTLGRMEGLAGDWNAAVQKLRESADRAEQLLSAEHDNMDTTAITAIAYVALGEVLLAQGRLDESGLASKRADALLKTALGHDDTVADWRNYRLEADMLDASIASVRGRTMEALKIDQAVLSGLTTGPQPQPNTERNWLLERARLRTGDDLAAMGRLQEAQEQWLEVTSDLANVLNTCEPRLLDALSAAEAKLRRTADAQAVTARLRGLFVDSATAAKD
jgi:tetratricopeptide (TPR) repeat protein